MAKIRGWNPEIKRTKILNTAVQILNRKEYYKCPIGEIAKKAGVAKGTVYLYFESKEELYFSIIFMLIDKMKEFADDIQKGGMPPSKKLLLLLEKQSVFMEKYRNIFLAIRQNIKSHKEKYHLAMQKKFGEIISIITKIIAAGIKTGEFKNYPSSSLAMLYMSLMFANAHQKIDMHDKMVEINITPQFMWNVFSKGISK
ncbi:MAG: TetR/AcrR family transcriptional regulator [Elusimicrobiota bacterium]